MSAIAFLRLIVGDDTDGFLELRHRLPGGGMAQRFYSVADLEHAAQQAVDTGRLLDAWVGVAPRVRKGGTAADVDHGWILSADLDDDAAVAALDRFAPPPTMIVGSGSLTAHARRAVHAHWALIEPVGAGELVASKRRLAAALGADSKCTDASRVMRVPWTENFKSSPPATVTLLGHWPERRYRTNDVVGHLPEPAPSSNGGPSATVSTPSGAIIDRETGAVLGVEPLKAIPAEVYVARLLELDEPIPASRKIRCPFPHPNSRHGYDRTPSFHVFADGWWRCFGCGRAGDIFDLAGYLVDKSPRRASDFLLLKDSLRSYFAEELAT